VNETIANPAEKIHDYTVKDSGRSLTNVLEQINLSCFECYGPNLTVGPHPDQGRVTVDTIAGYEKLIRELAAIPNLVFVPHTELNDYGCPPDKIVCSIRHDVDADIRAAVTEAEIEHKYGARSTWYILHTAPYYGSWIDGVHHRNGCMATLYRRMQDLGHEIALHTDPLNLYQNMHLDGAQAVREELAWLREQGLTITGTVAHNSAPIYGIENFAIFKGKNRKGLALGTRGQPGDELIEEIWHDGKWAPLGVLDEAELGLTYEGNDFFRRKDIRIEYGATRFLNRWRWDAHLKRWRKTKDPAEDKFVDQERMLDEIKTLKPGCWLILNVHPLYYGSRHAKDAAPLVELDRITTTQNETLGWETYELARPQAAHGDLDGKVEFQSLNFADERGMLDVTPPPGEPATDDLRVLILGGRNLDAREVGIPEHCHIQAAARLTEALGRRVRIRKLAFPGIGIARHFAWFERAIASGEKFDAVVIGIGADELALSHPGVWPLVTGWNAEHPPAPYLWADDAGNTFIKPASTGAAIRRNSPRPPEPLPSLADPSTLKSIWTRDLDRLGACLSHYADRIRENGAQPIAMLNECGESAGFWGDAAADNKQAHERTRCALEPMLDKAHLELVDPYANFLADPPCASTHWRSSGTWSHTGHRLAAQALYESLKPILETASTREESASND
jgi:hypothetical protein